MKTFLVRNAALAAIAASFVAVLAGCGGSGIPASAVGKVGNVDLSKQRVTALLATAQASYKTNKRPFPKAGTLAYRVLREQAVAYLVQEAMIEQRAATLGIHVTDAQVTANIATIKLQSFQNNEKKFKAALAKQGLTMKELRAEEKLRMIESQLQQKVVASAKVSDKQARSFYKANQGQFTQPQSRVVRHILVPTKAQADQLYSQLQAGADFAALAKQYSKDPGSAKQGGQLTVYRGQTVPVFDRTAFSLPTGQIAAPVHSRYGWHIIQALSPVKPSIVQPYRKVAPQIKQQLLQNAQSALLKSFTDKMDRYFCAGRIRYATGYKPLQKKDDPCQNLAPAGTGSSKSSK